MVTVPELAVVTFTPAEGSAIDREGDDMAALGNDRLHAHARKTCDWRWDALVDRSAKRCETRRLCAANEKRSVVVYKCTLTSACGDALVIGAPPEDREEEERLSPVGVIVRQRLRYATEAAFAVEQAQSLLYERWGAVKEFAELVAARELLRLHVHEHPHQQLGAGSAFIDMRGQELNMIYARMHVKRIVVKVFEKILLCTFGDTIVAKVFPEIKMLQLYFL